MKLDQIAYYVHNEEQAKALAISLGIADGKWTKDEVVGIASISGVAGRSHGLLRFNYDLGIEIEFLTYISGPHWHSRKEAFISRRPFLSHFGFHLDEGEPWPDLPDLRQELITQSHTNEYVVSRGRRYHYRIHRMPGGIDYKFIRRIEA